MQEYFNGKMQNGQNPEWIFSSLLFTSFRIIVIEDMEMKFDFVTH